MVIDGNAVVHRAFHALRQELTTSRGELTNAVYGFTTIVLKALQTEQPAYWAISFDLAAPTFRHQSFAAYKAHRPSMPEPLAQQFKRVHEVVDAFSIPVYEVEGFEADDVIGTLACQATTAGVETLIVTGDLDAVQLVTPTVTVLTPRRGADDITRYDEAAVHERYGLRPDQIPDYKGLVGDPSDNIPGVRGIGEKTATRLLQQYGTIEGLYEHLDALPEKQRPLLAPFREQALASKRLATIITDVPVTLDLARCRIGAYDRPRVTRLFSELEFRSLIPRLPPAERPAGPAGPRQVQASGTPATAPAAPTPQSGFSPIAPEPSVGLFAGVDLDAGTAPALTAQTRGGDAIALPAPAAEEVEAPPVVAEGALPTHAYVIDSAPGLAGLLRRLRQKGRFAVDVETNALDPIGAELVGLSLATEPGIAYYIPIGHERGTQLARAQVLDGLRPLLEDDSLEKVAHNGKYDVIVLAQHGIQLRGLAFDTMIAAYLLNSAGRGLGLKDLALAHFNVEMTSITDLIGKGKEQITMAATDIYKAAEYAAADADMALRLRAILEEQLKEKALYDLFRDVEVPLVPVLAGMELAGMDLDVEYLRAMSERLQRELDALVLSIYEAVGHPFNINSPKQLAQVLFGELGLPSARRTSTGYSTDAETLEGLRGRHLVVDLILEYRQLAKLKGTYVDGLPQLISHVDGRVHTDFNQTIAATGRLSSSNPNLQNIPIRTEIGRAIRRAFVVKGDDELLLTADYSQIELRILAHLSHDPILLDAFKHDKDIHVRTAALIFGLAEGEITPDMRRLAKTANYAIIYGLSEYGLSRETGIPRKEAAAFLQAYNKTYADLYEYMERTREEVRARGYVTTLLGRRRYVPEVYSATRSVREAAERAAINMPVQGTQADLIKIAMVRLFGRMQAEGLRSAMILQVHDELVFRVPKDELAHMAELARETMEHAMTLDVPIRVDVHAGKNWLDMVPVSDQLSAVSRQQGADLHDHAVAGAQTLAGNVLKADR
ncbi:MAG TPA: DNA polymerase I [Chloroflexota bacterium]|nr:DNA polymerase I [Chloroflexota bacterium]